MLNKKSILQSILLGICLFFYGCASSNTNVTVKDVQKVHKNLKKQVTTNITEYNRFLSELGQMLRVYHPQIIKVQSKPITNDTSNQEALPADVSKMAITALNKIGKPIVYIPFDPNYIISEQQTGGDIQRTLPNIVISGAITEYDQGIVKKGGGANLTLFVPINKKTNIDSDANSENSMSASKITMDFSILDYKTQTNIPGLYVSKSIIIYKKEDNSGFGFSIFGSGIGFNSSVSSAQGIHTAIRTLVEISIGELIAKAYKMPYWKILNTKKDPYIINALEEDVIQKKSLPVLKSYMQKYRFPIDNMDNNYDSMTRYFYRILAKKLNFQPTITNNVIPFENIVKVFENVPYTLKDIQEYAKYTNVKKETSKTNNNNNDEDDFISQFEKLPTVSRYQLALLFEQYFAGEDVDISNVSLPEDVANLPIANTVAYVYYYKMRGLKSIPVNGKMLFMPQKNVTRKEFAMFLEDILAFMIEDNSIKRKYFGKESIFKDVKSYVPYFNSVMLCVENGLLSSQNGYFNPNKPVSGKEVIQALERLDKLVSN